MRPRRFHLGCPHCGFAFWRRLNLRGATSCPSCHRQFARRTNVLPDSRDEAERALSHLSGIERNRSVMGRMDSSAIRARQVPVSFTEARFKGLIAGVDWVAHRPSWPDFLVETDDGLIAVETKSRNEPISPTQADTFELLERMGVRVYVWRNQPNCVDRLQRWQQRGPDVLLRPGEDVAASFTQLSMHGTRLSPEKHA